MFCCMMERVGLTTILEISFCFFSFVVSKKNSLYNFGLAVRGGRTNEIRRRRG